MNYILTNIYPDGMPDPNSLIHDKIYHQRWVEYHRHLESKKSKMTDSLKEFILSDWHYDPTDHRCPHDSWLEKLVLSERIDKEMNMPRILDVSMRLLGAYHDLYININYFNVNTYCFDQPQRSGVFPPPQSGHSDWLVDEISVIKQGSYAHKIVWASGAEWYIHFEDLTVTFGEIPETK